MPEFFKHHILSIDGVNAKWIEILSEKLPITIFKHLELHKMFMKHPSLNTQSCNRRPLCSTFRFEI